MNKILNRIIGRLIAFLVKRYRPEKARQVLIKTDVGNVLVNFPKEGGSESWIPNYKYPFPGVPDGKIVETITVIKRIFPVIYKWAWVIIRDRLPQYMVPQTQNGDIGLVDPQRYSKPVRELHRMFTKIRSKEMDDEMKGKWTEMRDFLCLFFEYDDAYRFRLMEAIQELDKTQFEYTEADAYWAGHKWHYKFDSPLIKEMREKHNLPWK